MCLVKHHGVSDAVPNSSAEHVFVEAIKNERRKCLLQVVILRRVNANDDGLLALPKALARFAEIEKAIVPEFLQARQQRPKSPVRLWIIPQNVDEALELRFM